MSFSSYEDKKNGFDEYSELLLISQKSGPSVKWWYPTAFAEWFYTTKGLKEGQIHDPYREH